MATEGDGDRPAATEPADALAELRAVVAKAKAGDASVLPRLRAILDNNPSLVKHYGDAARHAEAAWIALAGGPDLYMKEAFARGAEAQRAELTRSGAQPIERLLVERAVACGLQLNYFSATEANALAAGDTFRQLQFHAKRVGQAQRMFLGAIGALVTYQKLMPADAVVAAEAAVLAEGHEHQLPMRAPVEPLPQARIPIEVDSDSHEPAPRSMSGFVSESAAEGPHTRGKGVPSMTDLSELTEPQLMLELIMGALRVRDARLNELASEVLARSGERSVPRLSRAATDPKNKLDHRVRALDVLARIGPPYGLEMMDLSVLLHARHKTVREAARSLFGYDAPTVAASGDGPAPQK